MRTLLVAVAVALVPAGSTQSPSRCDMATNMLSTASFIACARLGTERYHDQTAALLDGYRRIGRDFPGMGEHWIRVGLVFHGAVDASRLEVLIYVRVKGQPQLLGVAYAVPLLRGEKPPDGPAGPDSWHHHSRTVEDETLLPLHHTPGPAEIGARLAMMHAWIWSLNPEGMFAADNWAIPYIRLGLTPNLTSSASVGKTLAWATGGREYFELAIERAARSTLVEKERMKVAWIERRRKCNRSFVTFAVQRSMSHKVRSSRPSGPTRGAPSITRSAPKLVSWSRGSQFGSLPGTAPIDTPDQIILVLGDLKSVAG
jgi:hypothetical protein